MKFYMIRSLCNGNFWNKKPSNGEFALPDKFMKGMIISESVFNSKNLYTNHIRDCFMSRKSGWTNDRAWEGEAGDYMKANEHMDDREMRLEFLKDKIEFIEVSLEDNSLKVLAFDEVIIK